MKASKRIISLIVVSIISISVIGCSNKNDVDDNDLSTNTSAGNEQQMESDVDNDLPDYKIALIDDSNIANAIRETIHIVIDGDYTLEQLESIAKKEALKYTKDNKVNALAIGFYEDEKNIGKGYDMGRVEYVPNGEWSDAINIQSGDYSNFKFVNHLEESISLKLPKGTSISEDKGETNVDLVKSDIKDINDNIKIDIDKQDDALIIKVTEVEDPILTADENTIASYTDWCLDNIKSDIKIIDFTVKMPSSSVRAMLETSKIETDNGRYYDANYIAENLK